MADNVYFIPKKDKLALVVGLAQKLGLDIAREKPETGMIFCKGKDTLIDQFVELASSYLEEYAKRSEITKFYEDLKKNETTIVN